MRASAEVQGGGSVTATQRRMPTARHALCLLIALLLAVGAAGQSSAAGPPDGYRPPIPTVRLAGPDRISTAVEVSRHGWDRAEVALLATAGAFPDALAGAALARHLDAPLLLTAADRLPSPVAAELVRLGAQRVILLGGTAAIAGTVSQDVRTLDTSPAVERIAGATRYATAAAIAEAAGPSGATVALASGATFADALAAGSLAAADDGTPILLTEPDALPAETTATLAAMRDAGADEVVIVGGTAAVADDVLEELQALGFDTVRLAGASRYETSLRVVEHVLAAGTPAAPGDPGDPADPAGGTPRPLVVTTGEGFPDALAAGALTARSDALFATVPSAWPQALHADLRRSADRLEGVIVVGGTGAVGDHVVDGVARAVGDQPWFDEPVDPLGLVLDRRYTTATTLGDDPWSVWACHVPADTADTTIGPERLPVDLAHIRAAAEALTARWGTVLSAGRWRPTFAVGGEVTVPAEDPYVRGGCVHEAITRLPADTDVRGVLVVTDTVGGTSNGGALLYDTCDAQRCGVDPSIHSTRRHAILPAEQLTAYDGSTSLVVLGHELGHAMGWPHVYRPNPTGDQYEDPMDLMAAAAGWTDGEWVVAPGTMAFNRYAAGWIDPADVAVHRGGSATYEVTALGSPGMQMVAVPGTETGALLTLEARVWDGIDRGLPKEGVQIGLVDQRGYPCGEEVGTCSGYRRMAPATGRSGSADHVLAPGEGVDGLGLRIDVVARAGSTFTVTVTGGPPDVPRFTD